jgi:hypothetical protein
MTAKARRRRNVAAGCFVALVVAGGHAGGTEAQAPRSVRIAYEVAPGCPDETSFEAQIRARTSKIVVATDGATSVHVRISPRGGRFEGEITLVDANGHESRRRVEGSCGDVAAALALITALALDPAASTASDPSVAQTAQAAASTPAPPPASAPPAPPPRPAAASRDSDSEPLGEELARTHAWGWSIGTGAGFTQGVAPVTLVSVPAFFEAWRRSNGAFAPAIRVRFERADSGTVSVAGAGADFTWTAGSLDLCLVAWSPWRFKLAPCLRAEGGVLSATGADVTPVRTDTRPWLTFGLVARARLVVVGSLFAEVEGGAFAPIVRDRFFVEPNSTIEQAPSVAAAGAAGIGVTFW